MPKGIKINDRLIIEKFKKVVANQLPFSLKINKNYSRFSDLIMQKTETVVSVSTLKRLFLYESDVMPSRNTLDLICQTIGIKDWDAFQDSSNDHSEFEHLEVIKSLELEGYRNKSDFKKIYEKFDYPEYKYFVTLYLIKNAIQKRDIDILKEIFMLPVFHRPDPGNVHQMYFLEYFGLLFRNNDIIYELIPYWTKDPVGQTAYCEFFVDVDNLKGYYGAVIEEYHKYKRNPEGLLFYHCMMYERDLQNGIIESRNIQFLLNFDEDEPIKTIHKTRRLALIITYNRLKGYPVDTYLDQIPDLMNIDDEYLRVLNAYTFCFLVFDRNDFYPLKEMLSHFDHPKRRDDNNIFTTRLLNMIKLYQSFVHFREWEIDKAIEVFQTIDPMYFSLYSNEQYKKQYKLVEKMIHAEKKKINL